MRTFDCFLFYNELDLLDLRLHLLSDVVDCFVLVESPITFQGESKEYLFEQNKHRFAKFAHKILHYKVPPYHLDFSRLPYMENPRTEDECVLNAIYADIDACPHFDKQREFWWGNDFFQRECIRRALAIAAPGEDDLILLSDVDEIPNPELLQSIKESIGKDDLLCLMQNEFCYYLNYFHNADWLGTCCYRYGGFRQASLNALRFSAKRNEGFKPMVKEGGGWHFTSIGSIETIRCKVQSWGHREYNNHMVLHDLDYNVRHGYDIFRRPGFGRLQSVELSDPRLPLQLAQWAVDFPWLIGPAIAVEKCIRKYMHSFKYFLQSKFYALLRRLRLGI